MKIEVGMYLRTKNGYIRKIKNIGEDTLGVDTEDIKKASHNIIELIEFGDYVNGEIVIDYSDNCLWVGKSSDAECYSRTIIDKNDIKEILTKELYEANCYEIGE